MNILLCIHNPRSKSQLIEASTDHLESFLSILSNYGNIIDNWKNVVIVFSPNEPSFVFDELLFN